MAPPKKYEPNSEPKHSSELWKLRDRMRTAWELNYWESTSFEKNFATIGKPESPVSTFRWAQLAEKEKPPK